MYETLKMDKIKAQEIIKYMQKKDMTPEETVATMHPATSNLVWCFGLGSNTSLTEFMSASYTSCFPARFIFRLCILG